MAGLVYKRWVKVFLVAIFMINIFFSAQWAKAASDEEDSSVNVIQQSDEKEKKDEDIVKFILFVTIDGLGDDSVANGYTPNLNGIIGSGVKTKALSVFPVDNASAIASIMTGVLPVEHKFTKSGSVSKVKSLPEMIAEQKQTTVIVDGKDGVTSGLSPKAKLIKNNKGDKETTDLAIKEFEANKPYFMHIILSGVDRANKKYGAMSTEYSSAVEEADRQVGRLLNKLHEYGLFQYSLVVVSGSYGIAGSTTDQKYITGKEVLVPLYMKGPTIEAGKTIPVASLTNIAPTVSYILGMKTANQNSQVLWDILKNEGGSSEAYLLKKRVNDLADSLIETTKREFALENEKILVSEEKRFLENQKGKVQDIIDAKDKEIKKRDIKLNVFKLGIILTLVLLIVGFILEYKILKKKFLMFK